MTYSYHYHKGCTLSGLPSKCTYISIILHILKAGLHQTRSRTVLAHPKIIVKLLGMREDGPVPPTMGTKCLKYDVTASLLSLRHVHPVFIQTLSSSYNVHDVKRRCSSRLKPVPEKFKPVLIQLYTVPIQFLTR